MESSPKPKMLEKDRKMTKPNNINNQLDSIYEISEALADESIYEDYWKPKLEKIADLIQQVSNLTDYLSSVNTQVECDECGSYDCLGNSPDPSMLVCENCEAAMTVRPLDPNGVDSNQLRVFITQPVKFLNTLKTIKNGRKK